MDETMFDLAKQCMAKAYAPYSGFRVGAVVRGASGRLYGGCNVENAAFPEGCCAETAATAVLVANGERQIAEVLIMGAGERLVTPCGGCRQRIREFADTSVPIHICSPENLRKTVTIGELLPLSFGPQSFA